MFFIYLVAVSLTAVLSFSLAVLLTVAELWVWKNTLLIFVVITLLILSAWGTWKLAKLALEEGKYWFK